MTFIPYKDHIAIITGSAQGFGKEFAKRLLIAGARWGQSVGYILSTVKYGIGGLDIDWLCLSKNWFLPRNHLYQTPLTYIAIIFGKSSENTI